MKIRLTPAQDTFKQHRDDLEYAFVGGVGSGKSYIGAMWTFARAYRFNERIIVCSQKWDSVEEVQFAAILKLMRQFGMEEDRDYTYNKKKLLITFVGRQGEIKGASGVSADQGNYDGWTGYHGVWIDEAWKIGHTAKSKLLGRCRDAAEHDYDGNIILREDGTPQPSKARLRYTGTPPLAPVGWYYQWLIQHPGQWCQSTTEDLIRLGIIDESYLKQQIESWKAQFGEDGIRTQVYGELPNESNSQSIFRRQGSPVSIPMSMGFDGSGGENGDDAYFIITDGDFVYEEKMKEFTYAERNAMALELIDKYDVKEVRLDYAYGNELAEFIRDNRPNVVVDAIKFARGANDPDKFCNARSEMYMNLANRWNSKWDMFTSERMVTIPKARDDGRFQLIEKEAIRKLIGHSPDGLDALALAMYRTGIESNPPFIPNVSRSKQILGYFDF